MYTIEGDILYEFPSDSNETSSYTISLSDDNDSVTLTVIEHPVFESGRIAFGERE